MPDLFPALDTTPELLGAGLAVALAYVLPIWAWSVKKEDVSIIDPFWGLGFVLLAWFWAFSMGDAGARQLLVLAMVTIWGSRLSIYLGWRKRGEPEDRRYQAMRKAHPDTFPVRSLFTVFLLQGFLIWAIGTPLFAAQRGGSEVPGTSDLTSDLGWLDGVGALLWLAGLFFEAVGDWQLARFKARREGDDQVLSSGLWRYTRHPNYFGDFLVWWGHFLVAAAAGGWWTIYAPLAMSVLLMRFSGVGPLEKDLSSTKPKYEDYVRRTNAFFPGPPGD